MVRCTKLLDVVFSLHSKSWVFDGGYFFFQLNMASILCLGFAVVVALAFGVDAQSSRRCSSVSTTVQDNNSLLLPLPLYLFLTSCLVLFSFPEIHAQ